MWTFRGAYDIHGPLQDSQSGVASATMEWARFVRAGAVQRIALIPLAVSRQGCLALIRAFGKQGTFWRKLDRTSTMHPVRARLEP